MSMLVLILLHSVIHLPAMVLRSVYLHTTARVLQRCADLMLHLVFLCGGVRTQRPSGRVPRVPTHGDLIVTNHASYLDIPYLCTFYSPSVFIVPSNNGGLAVLDTHNALRWSFGGRIDFVKGDGAFMLKKACDAARKQCDGPVVLFAEGTSTNGAGVLRFAGFAQRLQGSCFALALRYSRKRTECFTVENACMHVLTLLASLRLCIDARLSFVPDAATVNVQREVARLGSVPALSIGLEQHERFLEHWTSTAGGQGVKQYKR